MSAAKCERHQVWAWQMTWVDINDNRPAQQLWCPLCLSESVESLRARLVDVEALTNGQLDAVRNEQAKFRVDLSELGLRTDNHNASRKSEIEYLRTDFKRIDRINTGVLLGLADVLKMGPARELRLIGAKLVSRVADWLGGAK
jgi:hypothetical protein